MADVDRAKLQFVRDCAVQALRVWIDAPEKLKELIPKFEKGYDQLTDKGYGHPVRAQVEAWAGRGAAVPAPPKPQGPPPDPNLAKRRGILAEIQHFERNAQLAPHDPNWRNALEAAQARLLAHDQAVQEAACAETQKSHPSTS